MPRKIQVDALGLMSGLSHTGYSLETAIADIVDNSIDAEATRISIQFHFAGSSSYIQISDNGKGMTENELIDALIPGFQTKNDGINLSLGKYGLGLKSASFSQADILVVGSKKHSYSPRIYGYSKEHIQRYKDWEIFEEDDFPHSLVNDMKQYLENLKEGTLIRWDCLKITENWKELDLLEQKDAFLEMASICEKHLAMVFHRFLSGEQPIEIFLNDNKILPWDPFFVQHPSTQALQPELSHTANGTISVFPYVLPPRRQLSDDENVNLGGPRGWIAQQGFYIYRNKRLVISGGWLGFKGMASDEKHILARIKVDVPGAVDSEWGLDIMKSKVDVPVYLRPIFYRNAKATRNKARQTLDAIAKVNSVKNSDDGGFFWMINESERSMKLKLNWENPFIKQLLQDSGENRVRIKKLLKLVEATVPFATARMLLNSELQEIESTFNEIDDNELISLASSLFIEYVNSGIAPIKAIKLVLSDPNLREKEDLLRENNAFEYRKINEI